MAAKKKAKPAVKSKAKPKTKAKPVAKAKPVVMAKKAVGKKSAATSLAGKKSPNWSAHISPLEDRLIVAAEGPSAITAGGLIIPGTVNDRPFRGQVLAKGPGRRNKKGQLRPLDVGVGDKVLFSEWAGTKVDIEGREVLILREEDVLGIVT